MYPSGYLKVIIVIGIIASNANISLKDCDTPIMYQNDRSIAYRFPKTAAVCQSRLAVISLLS